MTKSERDVLLDRLVEIRTAKSQAHEAYGADGYSLAPLRRRGGYEANVWVNA